MPGEVWQLQEVRYNNDETITIQDPSRYTIEFEHDGSFFVRADCNVGSGGYVKQDTQLSLNLGPLTRAACPPDSYSDRYLQDLGDVANAIFDDDNFLYLNLRVDGGTLVFSAPPTPVQPILSPLSGTAWELSEIVYADHRVVITEPGKYTLAFQEEGSLSVKADCNLSLGSYTQTDEELAIALGPTTLALCPGLSLSDQYLRDLTSAETFVMQDGQLQVSIQGDIGTMVFESLKPALYEAEAEL